MTGPGVTAAAGMMLAAALGGAAAAADVDPLVEMADGKPSACGYLFEVAGIRVEVRLDRGAEGTTLSVVAPDADRGEVVPLGGKISRDCNAREPLPRDPSEIAEYMRFIAVQGADLCVARGDEVTTGSVPGPLPNQVRAAFLNCTGDLYRAGD